MSESTHNCGNCKHFVINPKRINESGFCHRLPPTCFLLTDPRGNPVPISQFPPVMRVFSCGEFAPKIVM